MLAGLVAITFAVVALSAAGGEYEGHGHGEAQGHGETHDEAGSAAIPGIE